MDAIDGAVSINLYDGSTNPQTIIASEGLGYIIDGGGQAQTVDFAIPAGIYDSLVVRAYAHNNWAALDIAYASDCVDDEPELPEVQNLTVDCTGLVTFDLETSEPVVLDVSIFIPAAAPGYRDTLQLSAESGPQQVQFDLPVRPYEWATSVSLGAEWLADAIVQGCPMQPLNTLPGTDVTVPVAGGTVTFENVLEPGETYVQQLDPEFAPPLPAEYQDGLVIMIDLSTTAVFSGSTEICLPIVGEVAADAENVRLLHFENGAWVDITTFASAADGVVCGVTSSFSPFAIVRMAVTIRANRSSRQAGGTGQADRHQRSRASWQAWRVSSAGERTERFQQREPHHAADHGRRGATRSQRHRDDPAHAWCIGADRGCRDMRVSTTRTTRSAFAVTSYRASSRIERTGTGISPRSGFRLSWPGTGWRTEGPAAATDDGGFPSYNAGHRDRSRSLEGTGHARTVSAVFRNAESRSISPENPTGARGAGGMSTDGLAARIGPGAGAGLEGLALYRHRGA